MIRRFDERTEDFTFHQRKFHGGVGKQGDPFSDRNRSGDQNQRIDQSDIKQACDQLRTADDPDRLAYLVFKIFDKSRRIFGKGHLFVV